VKIILQTSDDFTSSDAFRPQIHGCVKWVEKHSFMYKGSSMTSSGQR